MTLADPEVERLRRTWGASPLHAVRYVSVDRCYQVESRVGEVIDVFDFGLELVLDMGALRIGWMQVGMEFELSIARDVQAPPWPTDAVVEEVGATGQWSSILGHPLAGVETLRTAANGHAQVIQAVAGSGRIVIGLGTWFEDSGLLIPGSDTFFVVASKAAFNRIARPGPGSTHAPAS